MKVKLGWVVGVNVAAACLLMQGCKANRVRGNDYGNEVKTIESQQQPVAAPTDDIKVANAPAPAAQPAPVVQPAPAVQPAPVIVPEAPAPVQTAPAAEPEYTLYTVKPGDMLSKISKRYNIRQKAILDLNPGLSPNKLFAGKKIKLPGNVATGETAPAPAAVPAAAPVSADAASVKAPKATKAVKYTGATKTYVVKNGDSLGKIAHDNGTNVRTLKELNGLKKDRVFIGQKLKVPAEKAAAAPAANKSAPAAAKGADAKATAKPAQKKDAAVAAKKEDVKAADGNKPEAAVEKKPAAPSAAEAAAAPAADAVKSAEPEKPAADAVAQPSAPANAPAQQAALETHTVKEGEDVVSIAISYGVSPSALMDANDLKSSEVKPGDVLKIPAKNAQ